jgi:hypothetical protein
MSNHWETITMNLEQSQPIAVYGNKYAILHYIRAYRTIEDMPEPK